MEQICGRCIRGNARPEIVDVTDVKLHYYENTCCPTIVDIAEFINKNRYITEYISHDTDKIIGNKHKMDHDNDEVNKKQKEDKVIRNKHEMEHDNDEVNKKQKEDHFEWGEKYEKFLKMMEQGKEITYEEIENNVGREWFQLMLDHFNKKIM